MPVTRVMRVIHWTSPQMSCMARMSRISYRIRSTAVTGKWSDG